jgi:peptidoglycan hydrolase-like protein with peptidoglycan-binding domain
MTHVTRISKLSNSLVAGAGFALILAITMMTGFQYANAATVNILSGENLTVGSTGTEVAALQGIMSELGYLQVPQGVALGYFGALTRSAVARYQAARGVAPAAGYFGPFTKIALHQDLDSRNMLVAMGW